MATHRPSTTPNGSTTDCQANGSTNGVLTSNGHTNHAGSAEACSKEGVETEGDTRKAALSEAAQEALTEHNLPHTLPSLGEIKRALPSHVFESRVSTSVYYVVKDVAQVVGLFLLADWLWSSCVLPTWVLAVLVPGYWLLQGTLFWALFVLGHDAGHGSFSRSPLLNDAVGNALHGFVLCPYYCWKLSHRQHHAFTGNMDKDEVFYPVRSKQDRQNKFIPVFGFGVSWFSYLFTGYQPRPVNHFNPSEPMFARHMLACTLSITLVICWTVGLWHYALTAGMTKLLLHFAVPEFIFASYLVLTTFLHHTDEHVPWYDDSLWDFVRGQLSSVDRHYGWCHDIVHNIGTHQIHHLFTTIPHYHLEEATRAFRSKFPHLVRKRDESILPAFHRIFFKWIKQRVVPDSTLVHVYT
ncbi:sn-1 acyl-lipid omega-3 desaturase (ferredoxin)-like [Littorina saxatilis]|uniref:Fatty acid desaturase domain-containing protein n=1 Tax=Littorina saxatilis TaxID=31220 RepID=A0AAN9B4M2_9CAEN